MDPGRITAAMRDFGVPEASCSRTPLACPDEASAHRKMNSGSDLTHDVAALAGGAASSPARSEGALPRFASSSRARIRQSSGSSAHVVPTRHRISAVAMVGAPFPIGEPAQKWSWPLIGAASRSSLRSTEYHLARFSRHGQKRPSSAAWSRRPRPCDRGHGLR